MSMRLILFTQLLILGIGDRAQAVAPPVTVVKASAAVRACDFYLSPLDALERSLEDHEVRWGAAYVGTHDELREHMVRAGVSRVRADHLTTRLDVFLNSRPKSLGARYVIESINLLIRRRDLLTCVFTAECSLSTGGTEFFVADVHHPAVVVGLPFPVALNHEEFIVHFVQPFVLYLRQTLFEAWLETLAPGPRRPYARHAEDQNFREVFAALFETYLDVEIQRLLNVASPRGRTQGAAIYHDLLARGGAVARLTKAMGIKDWNIERFARRLIDEVITSVVLEP